MQTSQHTSCRVCLRSVHLVVAAELALSLRVTLLHLHSNIATVWHETAMPAETMPDYILPCHATGSNLLRIPSHATFFHATGIVHRM
jgi:hypothetical protein